MYSKGSREYSFLSLPLSLSHCYFVNRFAANRSGNQLTNLIHRISYELLFLSYNQTVGVKRESDEEPTSSAVREQLPTSITREREKHMLDVSGTHTQRRKDDSF